MSPRWKIQTPCEKSFSDLPGSGPRRFCDQCQLHVHDLSQMSPRAIDRLIRTTRGQRVCAQILHSIDGSIITAPTPTQRLRRTFLQTAASLIPLWWALKRPLQANPELFQIHGVVLDFAGFAIPGAKIKVTDGRRPVATLTSGPTGEYQTSVPPGRYVLTISADHFYRALELASTESPQELKTKLRPIASEINLDDINPNGKAYVEGFAVDPTGASVPKARVELIRLRDKLKLKSTRTALDGFFFISGIEPGDYEVRILPTGFLPFVKRIHLVPSQSLSIYYCELTIGERGVMIEMPKSH